MCFIQNLTFNLEIAMSNNTTTSAPNRPITEIMNNDDIGTVISKNKNALLAILIAIIVAVAGFGLYASLADKSKAEYNAKIHTFETTVINTWNENSDPKTLVQGISKLHKEIGNYSGLIPQVIKASDLLIERNHLNEALEILLLGEKLAKNEYASYFILSRLAVVYEDLGKGNEAIATLEKMNSQSIKIFEGKNYLDLGRLYLKAGNKEKARASFTYVVEKAKEESEFVKIAKLYLANL